METTLVLGAQLASNIRWNTANARSTCPQRPPPPASERNGAAKRQLVRCSRSGTSKSVGGEAYLSKTRARVHEGGPRDHIWSQLITGHLVKQIECLLDLRASTLTLRR